jgi:hypothetical protein
MSEFFVLFEEQHREAITIEPPCFNILSLCGITTHEVRHSAIIGWLLDETGSHGQGRLFFNAFMQLCNFDLPKTDMPYRTFTEFSCMESIIDVVALRKGDFILFLENKTVSPEGIDQLNREYRDLQRRGDALGIAAGRRYCVFLTLDGHQPRTGKAKDWLSISYGDMVAMLATIMSDIKDKKLELFLQDWMTTVGTMKG